MFLLLIIMVNILYVILLLISFFVFFRDIRDNEIEGLLEVVFLDLYSL